MTVDSVTLYSVNIITMLPIRKAIVLTFETNLGL